MEIKIEKGKFTPAMTWVLFKLKFIATVLKGFFSLPMTLWGYESESTSNRIIGKKSYFSKSGVQLVCVADSMKPGRYRIYGVCHEGDNRKIEFMSYVYNDRKYEYEIEKRLHSWVVRIDQKFVVFDVSHTPIFCHNLLPRITGDKQEDVTISLYDSTGV